MPASDVPEPWHAAMLKANLGDPRNGKPSFRALARASGIDVETVRQTVLAMREPADATVRAVAEALRVDVRIVSSWVGQSRAVAKPYEPPAEAGLLDQRERKAVDEIIRVMAAGKRQAVEQRRDDYGLAASDPSSGGDGERRRPPAKRADSEGKKSR